MDKIKQGISEHLKNQDRILLVGNGINDAQKIEWNRMLFYIQKRVLEDTENLQDEEEIKDLRNISPTLFLESLNKKSDGEKIQNFIKEYIEEKSNFVHKLWELYNVILTTNFDNNLAINKKDIAENEESSKDDSLIYSKSFLYRRLDFKYNKKQKSLFFVHGYYRIPESICLGFEQYTNNLKLIENHVVQYYSDKNRKKKRNRKCFSWIDYFFKNNITIDIMGLSLCNEEIDLWWILNYRKKILKKIENNKIYYYDLPVSKDDNDMQKARRAKIEILKSFDIDVIEINDVSEYNSDFYSLCIKKIRDSINTQSN